MPRRILVVDDVTEIRNLLVAMLEGFEVVMAVDGEDAARLLTKDSDFALVLSDVDMPNLDGFGLVQWMADQGLHIPIIIMSGRLDQHRGRLEELGIDEARLLPKPLPRLPRFLKIVNEAMLPT